jgi:hypothetical protein
VLPAGIVVVVVMMTVLSRTLASEQDSNRNRGYTNHQKKGGNVDEALLYIYPGEHDWQIAHD